MPLGNVNLTPQLVQAVRDAVDIVSIASEHTRLRKAGRRYSGLCPIHKEKTPSFSVDPTQGLFYCFGCGAGGDAIKLHMLSTGDDFPAATILAAVIRSWAWDVIEEICQSSNLVVLLKFCTARHSVDKLLGVGGHQDAKVVDADVPLSIWVPLQDIVPGVNSGLGFVVPHPGEILPTLPHGDVGADYVLRDPANLWIPPYREGDLTIHSRFSAHFTTGYGTLSDRYSVEIRAMPRRAAPPAHLDPVAYVARRNGLPTIVEAASSLAIGAQAFLTALRMDPWWRSR